MKKVVIFSDAHRKTRNIERIQDFHYDADVFVSCGDNETTNEYLDKRRIISVKGNYPFDSGHVFDRTLEIEGVRFFISHGHKYRIKRGVDDILKAGQKTKANIICFGHTHKIHYEVRRHTLLLNPGSCSSSRNVHPESFVVMTIENNICDISFRDALTNEVLFNEKFKTI